MRKLALNDIFFGHTGELGQAQAIKLGVSKALLVHDPSMKPTLRKGTFLFFPYIFVLIKVEHNLERSSLKIYLFATNSIAGCVTRDPRVVERKKPGQRKARAKYTWCVFRV